MTSGLSARGAGYGPWRVGQTKFSGAIVTQPDDDVWSIRPEERANSTCHLYRIVHTQPLQRLDVKHTIVKVALSTLIAMDTLPLTKHLSRHIKSPRFSASRGIRPLSGSVGAFYKM